VSDGPHRFRNYVRGRTVEVSAFGNSVPVSALAAKPFALLVLCLPLLPLVTHAQVPAPFPGAPANLTTLQVQTKAEEVFERGNYERAYFIYRELVPIGDKYSQYMVGYMYLTGKGVPEDRVLASAWYRLAAERDTPEFVKARDELMDTLTSEQRAVSDRQFVDLRKEFGDLKLLMNAIRSDYQILKSRTGSKLGGSDSSPMTVIDSRRMGAEATGADFYGRIERRIEERLDYISRHTDIEIVDLNPHTLDINRLEAQVDRSLESP
jgi:Sel1 repeat